MASDYGGCEDGDEDDDWGENVGEWCDVDYVDYVDNVAMFWFNIYSNWFNSFVFFLIWLDFIGEMMKIVKWWRLMFDYFN